MNARVAFTGGLCFVPFAFIFSRIRFLYELEEKSEPL